MGGRALRASSEWRARLPLPCPTRPPHWLALKGGGARGGTAAERRGRERVTRTRGGHPCGALQLCPSSHTHTPTLSHTPACLCPAQRDRRTGLH